MASSFYSTIILIGAIQGFVMSILLFQIRSNKTPARTLAWLLILFSIASINIWSWSVESWQGSRLYNILVECLPLIVIMPVGPLIWLYVKSSLDPDFRIGKKEKRHFLPVIIDLVCPLVATTYICMLLLGMNNNYGPSVSWFIDTYNVYSDIPRWASVTYYCWLSVRVIRKSEINVQIDQHNEHISWLRQFLYLFIIFQVWWFIYLVPYTIPKFTDWMLDNVGWFPIYVPLALLIYTLGTKGYIQVRQIRKINQRPAPLPYDEQQLAEIIAALKATMEDQKLYLDPTLNLASFSSITNIPAKQISTVLNQHLQKSFNEFVNEYRVSEVVRRLSNQEAEKWTIAGIAYESGFNSQPTFQRSFKSVTGKTPSQYLASLQSTG